MSCERTIKTFETVEVKIDTCNKKELEELEKSIVSAINQKLEKLNILIRNCDIYSNGKCILVHDRFNICSSLKEVAEAFGLECELVNCSLRGKTYLIADQLLCVLKQIDVQFNFGSNVANKELNGEIENIMGEFGITKIDAGILEMVRNIKKNGVYTTTKTREVLQTFYDGRLIDHSEGGWSTDEGAIRDRLLNMSKEAENVVKKTNAYLRDGTTKLIYTRARQMGYAVQEVKKRTQTQLVLVRYE